MKTDFNTLLSLARYTVNHLTEKKYIAFTIDKREQIIEALATELGVSLSTDEDIQGQAIEEVEEKLGEINIPDDITESEMYHHARKEIVKSFQGETIAGLYMVESLHKVAGRVKNFLLESDLIEDVFATDDEILDLLIKKIRKFSIEH
jgi:predicted urease superfamily metal-dependent hydrolase